MKSPSRYLNDYLRRTTPSQAYIKKWAHAATLAFAALIVPSLCAIYFRQAGIKEAESYWVWASVTIWKIHGVVAVIALLLWVIEKPRMTRYEPVAASDSEGSDPPRVRNPRLRLLGLAALAGVLGWLTYKEALFAYNGWRWGRNEFVLLKIVVRTLTLAILTLMAAVVPVLFLVAKFRAALAGKKPHLPGSQPTPPEQGN